VEVLDWHVEVSVLGDVVVVKLLPDVIGVPPDQVLDVRLSCAGDGQVEEHVGRCFPLRNAAVVVAVPSKDCGEVVVEVTHAASLVLHHVVGSGQGGEWQLWFYTQ
jgi:hypothetical protein